MVETHSVGPRLVRARPDPRLRLAVHAADRAPRARGWGCSRRSCRAPRRSRRSERASPSALILSAARPPAAIRDAAPLPDPGIYALRKPLLGICYGFQATRAAPGRRGRQGRARRIRHRDVRRRTGRSPLFAGVPKRFQRVDEPRRRSAVARPRLGEGRAHLELRVRGRAPRRSCRSISSSSIPRSCTRPTASRCCTNFLFRIARLEAAAGA